MLHGVQMQSKQQKINSKASKQSTNKQTSKLEEE